MNKITFLFTVFTLVLAKPVIDIYAQNEEQKPKDTLIVGGIYSILLVDGRDFTGELTSKGDSTIEIEVAETRFKFGKSQIKAIDIADVVFDENTIESLKSVDIEKKFSLISSFQVGICVPTGNFSDMYKTGFGAQISAYHLFDRVIGVGTEVQWNNFPGKVFSYNNGYENVMTRTGSFNTCILKFNMLLGNLNPENKLIFYGLFGIGFQYYSEGDKTSTQRYFDPYTNEYQTNVFSYTGSSGLSFLFGAGGGAFYKISKKIGINGEIQFNKLPQQEHYFFFGPEGNSFDGNFSFKAGITYAY